MGQSHEYNKIKNGVIKKAKNKIKDREKSVGISIDLFLAQ